MIQRFVKKLPGVLQTEVQQQFYSATFDQLFNSAAVEQAQGFIGRRGSDILNPDTDNYLSEPTKLRAAYQLEPIAYAVNAALEDTNQYFYDDLLNYIDYRGGNTLNHDRLFADLYYSFAPPIDYDKFLNYQNYLWLENGGPIVYIQYNGTSVYTDKDTLVSTDYGTPELAFDALIEDAIIGQSVFNTSTYSDLTPTSFSLSSGMRVQFEGSSSYDRPYWVEGVGRQIRLVAAESNLLVIPNLSDNATPADVTIFGYDGEVTTQEPIPPGTLNVPNIDHTIADYITVERSSCEGSPWTRTNRWMHEDAVDAITLLGQLLGGTVTNPGVGYFVGDVIDVNIGDGVNGSFIVTSAPGGNVATVDVFNRGQGYSFATADQSGAASPIVPMTWDFGVGEFWDDNNTPFITIRNQDETFFDNVGDNGTFFGGTGYAIGEVITMSDGSTITVDNVAAGVVTEFTIATISTTPFTAGTTHTVVLSTLAGNDDFTLTTDVNNEIGRYAWDDDTLTSGAGSGVIIEALLASAVSRSNKGTRPILEFKRDLELFDFGNKYIGEINVVAATESFTDIAGQAAGLEVDGIELIDGMRLIFLDPQSVPLINEWDDDAPTGNPGSSFWDGSGTTPWELDGATGAVTRYIWQVDLVSNPGVIELVRVDITSDPLLTGPTVPNVNALETILVAQGQTYQTQMFYQNIDSGTGEFLWQQAQEKNQRNKQPLFELYDTDGISLADSLEYPSSDFAGNELYSYKVLTQERLQELGGSVLVDDPILGFPVETKGLRQLGDILFENDMQVTRSYYTPVGGTSTEINGYYFFKLWDVDPYCNILTETVDLVTSQTFTYETNWKGGLVTEELRIVDRYLTTSDTEDTFPVSGVPVQLVAGPANYVVTQGRRLNTDEFIYQAATQSMKLLQKPTVTQTLPIQPVNPTYTFTNITENLYVFIDGILQTEGVEYTKVNENTITFLTNPTAEKILTGTEQGSGAPGANEVVEILTYTFDPITDNELGYFEIPNGLENNPNNLEITENSWNEFTPHYTSIITEQASYLGTAFGSGNNYRDTIKDGSLGNKILQNQSPMLKTMLVSQEDERDMIEALRLSSSEYTRFKNRFTKTALQLINEGFTDFNYGDTIPVSQWVDEIIRRSTRAREYGDAFKDTYMIAWNNVYTEQTTTVNGIQPNVTLTDFVDLEDKRNALYVYIDETLLQVDTDYTFVSLNPIQIKLTATFASSTPVITRLYENTAPAYIPATPSKLGMYKVYKPAIITDSTYAVPTEVIVGHDGSKTPTYGDERDELLIELENRIYNGILEKFRGDYEPPLVVDSYKPGKFRDTRWTLNEWNDLIKSSFFKWASQNKTDYITNAYYDAGDAFSWNYSSTVDLDGETLPGYWRAIYDYYYDTQTPAETPWEMLGFTEEPTWWVTRYGTAPYVSTNTMWADLETGTVRGAMDADTYVDDRYIRTGLVANYLPVTVLGASQAAPLLTIDSTGSLTNPTADEAQLDYTWTDLAPVEYAWTTSESYPFAVMEALYLARPAEFGEQLWDTEHNFNIPIRPTQIVNNENDLRERIGNDSLYVHGETVSGVPQIHTGYQVWITNRLRALKKNVTTDFGDLIRTLDVKLGHKMASFTDADTLKVFVEGISVSSLATNLLVPTENINVTLYTGAPVQTYMYSGVLIKSILVNNEQQYQIFGYDLLSGEFEYYPRVQSAGDSDITVGGQPASFRNFETGVSYSKGQIVRLNGIYYTCAESHAALTFENDKWLRLRELPITGGVSITYRKKAADTKSAISYGHKFSDIQEVFDFLIGYGEAQAEDGWAFDTVDTETNTVANWYNVAKDYMFWVATQWEQNSILMLSPSAQLITLNANEGYPANVEKIINGVYTILDKNGVVIDPINTSVSRVDRTLSVSPNIEQTGIYAMRAITRETENIITFDNTTAFNDIIYDPKLGSRLSRVDFNGRRTLDWTGKLEAAGFIITADGLLPNYENLVNSIRNYHNTEELLDNPTIESVAQHLIGFEARDYFTDLGILDDAAYQFYQGMIKEKGTVRAVEKMERNRLVTNTDNELNVVEEWALKLEEWAGVCANQFTEFKIAASEVKVDPQLVQLSYPASQQDVAPRYVFASGDVSTAADTITIANHAYRTGEPKLYSTGGGTVIGGLVDDTVYYIIVIDTDTFQLAQTKAAAVAATPTPIILTTTGSGSSQSLTPWSTGTVDGITVLSATNTWLSAPLVFIVNHPDDTTGSGATATSVLDTDGTLLRIDMLTVGTGYTEVPRVYIGVPSLSAGADRAIASLEFDIVVDTLGDDVIVIDVDDETRWITKPDGAACNIADELWPATTDLTYSLPNSGYVHLDDVDFQSFSEESINDLSLLSSPPSTHGQTIHVARDARESFGVYFMDNYRASTLAVQTEAQFDGVTEGQGTFYGGTGYAVGEDITLSDGTVINVDAESGNVVTEFTILTSSTSYFPARGSYTLTAVSSTSTGNDDFTLTTGIINEKSGSTLATGVGATLTQTPVIADDGQVTLSSAPREDVIEATLTIDVDGTGVVSGVTIVDGGLGYTQAGSFTISDLTHGAERNTNETDAVISFSVNASGEMVTPVISTPGSGYARNVATVIINAPGSTYSIDDVLTPVGGTGIPAQFVVDELTTIVGDTEAEYDATGATQEGTFVSGTGHAAGDVITMSDGSTITVDAATGSVIAEQTEADFDNSPTTEGTFAAGTGYTVGDLMTMTDGSVVQVTNVDTGSANEVLGFTITSDSTTSVVVGETVTVLVLPASGGTGFTLTLDSDNVKYPAGFGEVTEFTVTTATVTGITTQESTLTQASSSGSGIDFALNMGVDNQGVFGVSILDAGAYALVLPSASGAGTTVSPAGGTLCLVDLTFIGVGIPVNTADVSDPIGYLRYLGNEDPGMGKLYINNTLYDYEHISGLNYTLSLNGSPIDDEEFNNTSPAFYTLANLRFRTIAERTVFETQLGLMGATQTWVDDNGSSLWEADAFSATTIVTPPSGADITLLADFDGADAATAFIESSNNLAVASFVGTAQLDTAQSNSGTASLLLDGNSDYVTFPDIAAYDLSTNEWTMEGFVRLNTIPPNTGSGGAGFALATLSYDDGGAELLSYVLAQDGFGTRVMARYAGTFEQNTTSMSINTWYHWAMVKTTANGIRLYFDGNYRTGDFGAISNDMGTSSVALQIGARGAAEYTDGWIDDVKFTNGTALYTGNTTYTIPTAPFTPPSAGSSVTTYTYAESRIQEELIETYKFVNAYVYEADTKDTLALIPVYDPFKGIIPGTADINIKYRAARDPARYTNASTASLINRDQAFDSDQVGEVWWDISTCAYLYYEQDSDTYRRDNWGALFNGSSVDIYEWTRSTALPSAYDGDGTVRNTTDYVELEEWDPILEEVRTYYYYWVKGRTVVPGVKNRTLAAFEVANIITNPTANLYQWFSPVSQTGFMFAGVDNVFTDSDNIFQINFRRPDEELRTHVEWELGRENDPNYVVNDKHWNKMVDSICGYTDAIAIGASAYTDNIVSFETDATSVITAAPDMIVAHVIATFVTDVTGVNAGTNRIGTVAAHGLTTGDPVVYSTRYPGAEDVGLVDGTTYYVNVASTTTFSLHTTPTLAATDTGRVTLNTSGAETHAFCSQAHGLTNLSEVTYSTAGGTAVITLVDGESYFVEVITPTALALHTSYSAASIANPGTRVDLIAAGTAETHTLTEPSLVLRNFNNAIPSAADPTTGYLVVPDPNISTENQLGIKTRPLQTMFLDILGARRIFVDKVNDLVETIILRDENPTWNSNMTTNNLWEWVDWYEAGYDETNAIPIRQVTDTSDLATLLNPLDGDVVKVTGTRWALYVYDIDSGLYSLIGREASRLNLLSTIYEDNPNLDTAIELRELISALQTQVFIGDRAINNNLLFFALLNYVFSEQSDIDWAFKTTYVFLDQTGQVLTQDRVFQDDPFDSALDYINEAKPFQTKIRDFRITRATENDEVNGTAEETSRTFDIFNVYDQIRGGDLSVTEMRIAKAAATQAQTATSNDNFGSTTYRGYSTLDAGATLVRLGAAGRFVNNQRDELINIPLIISDNLADYDPGQSGPIPDLSELEAVAAINAAMTTEFFFDYQGNTLQNTSFGGLPTLESAVLSAPGTGGYLVGDILELSAGGGVPISPAVIRVDTISGGGIATFSIINGGSYQQTPTADPVLLIGGSGNGDASLTTLLYENGSSVPHDTTPWDQIGFESSVFDTAVTTLDGLGNSIDGLDLFADIPAEETFNGNGIQKEFEITTTVPTFFMFVVVDGVEQTLNVDYFYIGSTLTFVSILTTGGTRSFGAPPAGTANIELYTYIEAGDLINPQVRAGVTEEMVPLDPRENLIVIADTMDVALAGGGTGYAVNDEVEVVGGVLLQSTIAAQTQANFDGAGSNGTFTTGANYKVGDVLTMRDQSTVTVNTVTAGAVATFTITTASGKGFQPSGTLEQDAIVQIVDTEPKGSGFTLTTDTNNEADFGLPMTIRVDTEAGNVITGFTVIEQGDYFTYPTNPVAVTDTVGGGNNDATFTLTSISFRIHNDTRQNFSITRNADSMSTTLTSTIGLTDTVIPVTDETLLYTTAPTVESPQVAWIGTERIVYHGVNAVANEISGCIRGTAGTSAQTHSIGSKIFGTETQTVPGQNIFWVNSLTTNYHSGTLGRWRYTGAPNVFFTDSGDTTIHSGTGVLVGDTLRVTTGTLINKSYLITDLVLDGEVARIDITAPGTGYVVGDTVDLSGLTGAVGATAEVGGVDVNGGITYVTITNRGVAGVSDSSAIGVATGNGDASLDVYYNTEGLVLMLTGDIINPDGVVVEFNAASWEIDRANPGGLAASTTTAALFLNAEAGNVLPISISP